MCTRPDSADITAAAIEADLEPGLQCWGRVEPWPEYYAAAYSFHTENFDKPDSNSKITVSGNTITVNTDVFTSVNMANDELFNDFETWVEDAWDKSVIYDSTTYQIRINLRRVQFASVADIIVRTEIQRPPEPGSSSNVVCGSHSGRTITIINNTFCDKSNAAAHEFGHELGFEEAYQVRSDGTIVNSHARSQDIMTSAGTLIEGYHGRVLKEKWQ